MELSCNREDKGHCCLGHGTIYSGNLEDRGHCCLGYETIYSGNLEDRGHCCLGYETNLLPENTEGISSASVEKPNYFANS